MGSVNSYETYVARNNYYMDNIIQTYASLVNRIAQHLIYRLPKNVQLDDLIQVGMIGLLEAAKNFDESKGASFTTYASIRIRGTMLDEVRKNDWLPRSVYRQSRMIAEATHQVENRLGRDANDTEICNELGMALDEYHHINRIIKEGQLFGFDDLGLADDVLDGYINQVVEGPLNNLQQEDFVSQLTQAINSLPERERQVLVLYYDEEYNLKEIGRVLGVSESRVCQIHTQAMQHVKQKLPDWRSEA